MKHILKLSILSILVIAMASCQKVRTNNDEVDIVSESYSASINNNETYTFYLPSNDFHIATDALNAEISQIIGEDNSYSYTPLNGFIGEESIRLTNEKSVGFCGTADMNNRRSGSNCQSKEDKTYYNYNITLTVNEAAK